MPWETTFCGICGGSIKPVTVGTKGELGVAYHWKNDKKIHPECDPEIWARVLKIRESRGDNGKL